MSIAGYVLKAARAKDGLPGRAVGPGDVIVGDRLQAEGERVRVSPAIKPMKNWSKLGQFPSSIKPLPPAGRTIFETLYVGSSATPISSTLPATMSSSSRMPSEPSACQYPG